MEGNKDESMRCVEIAIEAHRVGDRSKAVRFLKKSISLYPNDRATTLLEKYESEATSETGPRDSVSDTPPERRQVANTQSRASPASSQTSSREYTQEQLQAVQRVKKCKDYYAILEVTKEATDADIKKAYRKLALMMHPDKNPAPGADEAFKAVSQAFSCLSDQDKRRHYDQFGAESPQQFSRGPSNFSDDPSEMTPEELFQFFFSGVPPQRGRMNRHHRASPFMNVHFQRRGGGGQQQQATQIDLATVFIQFLPILLVLYLLFSFGASQDPVFSLRQMAPYNSALQTTCGTAFYVADSIEREVKSNRVDLKSLYREVDREMRSHLTRQCETEKIGSERVAKGYKTNDFEKKFSGTQGTACERLRAHMQKCPT